MVVNGSMVKTYIFQTEINIKLGLKVEAYTYTELRRDGDDILLQQV